MTELAHILVVDDDANVRRMLLILLSNGVNLCENCYSHRDHTHQERGCPRTHSESGDKVESRTAVKTVYLDC